MKFDKSKLKTGDVCVLRCGGRLVVDEYGHLDGCHLSAWDDNGRWAEIGYPLFFDIISVEPAPEPVVVTGYVNVYPNNRLGAPHNTIKEALSGRSRNVRDKAIGTYKITITDGKPEIERVE